MNLDEHWYVLLTIRSKEEEVCKYLNENEGIFAFSPKMKFIIGFLNRFNCELYSVAMYLW